tara:strand:+ start:261 stop:521 length:261 start_codon:yes stop_codon:yes gene_type:complete
MSSVIYIKPNCEFCVRAKMLLHSANISYSEIVIGKDIIREEFLELYPEQKTVPLIFINGTKIGGFSELREWIELDESKEFLTEGDA